MIFLKTIFTLVIIVLILFLIAYFVNLSISAKGYSGPISDHFDGQRFWNIGEREGLIKRVEKSENEGDFNIFTFFNRPKTDWAELITPEITVPNRSLDLKVTHINHATALIQVNNLNIITDPVYSYRVSPFSFFGPKRYTNPRISFTNLPPIDVIIISHNHYDHMDLDTLKNLQAKSSSTKIIVGLGNKEYLEDRGIVNVIETDWYTDTKVASDVNIKTVPAQHFSARGLTDRNKTLWVGYVVEVGGVVNKKIYFAGDTGYGPFVKNIAELYPEGFDLALLPIGAYKPRYFMSLVHVAPVEALQMMKDLKIREGIAIHFGTFPLALDKQTDPGNELEALKQTEEYKNLNLTVQK